MKIVIEIPEEFERDYNEDKFQDFFSRVLCDMRCNKQFFPMCGNYEKETVEMFLKSFSTSHGFAEVKSEVIDEFAKLLKSKKYQIGDYSMQAICKEEIDKIAEQLKEQK